MTFAPGETRKCIQFSALSDDVKENTERIPLTIALMEQEGVSVGDPGETVVNIIDATGRCMHACVEEDCRLKEAISTSSHFMASKCLQVITVTNKTYVCMYVCTYVHKCANLHSALRKMLEEDEVLSAMESK